MSSTEAEPSSHNTPRANLVLGLVWIVGAFWFMTYNRPTPIGDLRLLFNSETTTGEIVETHEDAEDGDDGRTHWSSTIVFRFRTPDGRVVYGASRGSSRLPSELVDVKQPVPTQVEYHSGDPSLNRLAGGGSRDLFGWIWRAALFLCLLGLFSAPGVIFIKQGVMDFLRSRRFAVDAEEEPTRKRLPEI